jgi:hypothetical protein
MIVGKGFDMSESGLRFEKCVEFAVDGVKLPVVKTVVLADVVKTFEFNVGHTLGMIWAPAVLSYTASEMQRLLDQGELRATGTLSGPPLHIREFLPQASQVHNEALTERASLSNEDQFRQMCAAIGRGLVFVDISAANPQGRKGYDAILASLIIGSWTAFETMAADLWEAALNEHPEKLAELSGETQGFKRGEKQERSQPKQVQEKGGGKTVYLEALTENNYDVEKKMGTILRHRFGFSSLFGARMAYGAAFGEEAMDVKRCVMDDSLDALSAVRNVLVHKSGVIDKDYQGRKAYLKDKIPSGEIGQRLSLDGVVAVGFIKPALEAASSLIRAVDDWLIAHAPPQ